MIYPMSRELKLGIFLSFYHLKAKGYGKLFVKRKNFRGAMNCSEANPMTPNETKSGEVTLF